MDARLTKIDSSEVMRYLGVRGAPDPELLARVEARSAEFMAAAKPRLVWRRLPMTQENDYLIAGQDLRNLLRGCREIVLFAATLGSEAETHVGQQYVVVNYRRSMAYFNEQIL